jgi:hypothetical protein
VDVGTEIVLAAPACHRSMDQWLEHLSDVGTGRSWRSREPSQ